MELSQFFVDIVCYLKYTGRLLDVLSLLLPVILLGLLENPGRNLWVTEKSTKKNLREGYHFFSCMSPFLCHFFVTFSDYSFPSSTSSLRRKNFLSRKWYALPPSFASLHQYLRIGSTKKISRNNFYLSIVVHSKFTRWE